MSKYPKSALGATAVVIDHTLKGIITDGDIRRMLEKTTDWYSLKAKDIMSHSPKTIEYDELASVALATLESNNISVVIVVLKSGNYHGIVHIHDILKEGIGS